MRSKFKWIFTLLLALSMQFSFAQEKTVTGVVSDATGTLPGANVVVKGTTRGTQTDIDGKYSIKTKVGEVLVFSFIGMTDMSKTVGASNTISVNLSSGPAQDLGEVVIEGYKTVKKTRSSNATTTISAATIEGKANASFIQTLQGQVSGLNISTGSGQPGSNSTVILRGAGSINGNIEPLYVIDGVPMNTDSFRSINPNDIESASVLKDAGATAIYGNRGANGVIVVNTKKGSYNSGLKIKYTSVTGFTELQDNKYDVMNTTQLLAIQKIYGAGLGNSSQAAIDKYKDNNTDWKKYFFRTGMSQNHNLSLSSGGESLSSFTSLGYFTQQGILQNTDLSRFNFRNNLTGRSANKKLSYSTSTTINFSRRNEANSLGTGGVNQNFVLGANSSLPYISPDMYVNGAQLLNEYQNGDFKNTLALTPLLLVDKIKTYKNTIEEMKIIMNGKIDYQLTKDLSLGTSAGLDYTQNTTLRVQDPDSFNSLYFAPAAQEYKGNQNESFVRDFQFISTTNLRYNHTFGEKHDLTVAAFTEYNKGHYKNFGYTQTGLITPFFYPGNGTGFATYNDTNYYVPSVSALKMETGLFSYFGNLDYDYDSKYGFGATIRRDASFRFSDENKWGTFWSVSARWNLDKENFMKDAIFNKLKLRGSYGTTGNQNIVGQNNYNAPNLYKDLAISANSYANQIGYYVGNIANKNLKWETTSQLDFGIDFDVFKSRLTGVFDVYEKKTEDLYQGIPKSAILGTGGEINANFGSLRNRGIELSLNYDVITSEKGFNLSLSANASYNKNQLLELPNAEGIIDYGLSANREGDVLDQFYLVKYAGVNPANGNLLFYDKNGGLTENPTDADRRFTGKSSLPVYQGAFGFDASYKGFFLTSQFTFVADIYRFDYDLAGLLDPSSMSQFNVSTDLINAWTPTNRITDVPALKASNASLDSSSDRFLKDASYIRMRSLNLGYKFPKTFLDKTSITGLKIYAQAENYLTFTKWRGWDAESDRGADQYQYPTPKILSFGLEIQF